MRGVFRGVLVALVLAGCVPRAELRGTGGSGNFQTIKARLLMLIAGKEYSQAREYLELAADLTQEQHDRVGTADPALWDQWLAAFNNA